MIRKLSSLEDILTLLEENKKNGESKMTKKGSLEDICQLFEKEAEKKEQTQTIEKKLVKKGSLEDIAGMFERETENSYNTVHEGKMYNTSGYSVCGVLNQHNKPCQRIGKCPFHHKEEEVITSPRNIMPKLQYPIKQQDFQLLNQQQQIYEQTMKNQNFEFLLPNNQPNSFSKFKTNELQNTNMMMNTNSTNQNSNISNHLLNRITPIGIPMKVSNGLNPSLLNSLNPMSNNNSNAVQQINLQIKNEEEVVSPRRNQQQEDIGNNKNNEKSKDSTVQKKPFKHGWTKEEHLKFLTGLEIHGKGQWKQIATLVGTRSPTQIQSHAQKYFLRQNQQVKNKRSIHDLTIEDLKSCFSDEKKQKTE